MSTPRDPDWPKNAPGPRDDEDADSKGEPDDEETRRARWRDFVREHPDQVTEEERLAVEDE